MTSTKTTIPFTGTAEQKAALEKVIADHKGKPGALMPVMQQAQDIYGYLPIEVQTMIAEGLGCSLEQVYELVKLLGVTAGHTTPDGMFTVEAARCLGCCGLAPVMMIDDQVYGRLVPADVKGIIDKVRAE